MSVCVVSVNPCPAGGMAMFIPRRTALARSSRSPLGSRSSGVPMIWETAPPSAWRVMTSADSRIAVARSEREQLRTLPPYISVGFPSTPQRPGAVAITRISMSSSHTSGQYPSIRRYRSSCRCQIIRLYLHRCVRSCMHIPSCGQVVKW